jgi:pimeloyl-ACP methyl ester carboxylesterase
MAHQPPFFGASCTRNPGLFARCACAALLVLGAATAEAKEVTLRHKGLTLNASLELAAGKKLADGVILITHGGLAHRDAETIAALRGQLNQKGYSTLAINLGLGLDKRHGMYDCQITHRHRNTDAAEEIGLWVDWLKRQGTQGMVLLGHSRGGAQTALYASAPHNAPHNAPVKAVVLMAPAIRENTDAEEYQRRFNKPLAPVLAQAQKLVAAGKGDTVLEHLGLLNCPDTSATANAFVSYYGPSPGLDAPSLIPKIAQPTLVVVAGGDEVVVNLGQKVAPLADGRRVQVKMIDGADHFFRDLYTDEAVEIIDVFVRTFLQSASG